MTAPNNPSKEGAEAQSPERRALLALRTMRAQLEDLQAERSEPIAVIGMSCRLPGDADTPELFWTKVLRDGVDTTGELPEGRWDHDLFFDPDLEKPAKFSVDRAAFLRDPYSFDSSFFGIAPSEAEAIDPQHRIMLELVWEALEDAGVPPFGLRDQEVGVFAALSAHDWCDLLHDPSMIDAHMVSGVAHSIGCGRISYFLGVHGPCFPIETACSSALVAAHLAVQSLRRRECNIALLTGASIIAAPYLFMGFAKMHALAPDGRCKTYDAAADGYARGEGGGTLVLKRLRDAKADGDRILAVIRGSACNQDGASSTITAPNGIAQQAVYRRALEDARLVPGDVSYVEAHGTGTLLGDPIEFGSLQAVYGAARPVDSRLSLGSVKTNVGHLEGSAGLASLIKTILALQNEQLPPHLNLKAFNPMLPVAESAITVPTGNVRWPRGSKPRIAAMSSFGFGGTNAHLIIEEAPAQDATARPDTASDRPLHVLTISAQQPAALNALASRHASHLNTRPAAEFPEICYSAAVARSHLEHRACVVAASSKDAVSALEALARGEEHPLVTRGRAEEAPRIAFLFPGVGTQYVGMARRLYQTEPVFRAALERCATVAAKHLERPLLEVMNGAPSTEGLLDRTSYMLPATFSVGYSLAELWRSWGITPSLVLGHSSGEIAAACVAGAFSLETGLKLIAERGRLMDQAPAGAMYSVMAEPDRVAKAILPFASRLSVAALNGPQSTVISGHADAVETVARELAAGGITGRRINIALACHSSLMDPVIERYRSFVATLEIGSPSIDLVSTVTGELTGPELADPQHWVRNLREPVRFAAAVQTAQRSGCNVFLELGPHTTLTGMGAQATDGAGTWLASLRRGSDDAAQILQAAAGLHVVGGTVDWRALERGDQRRRVSLPAYAFQRRQYSERSRTHSAWTRQVAGLAGAPEPHPVLGRRLVGSGGVHVFEQSWSLAAQRWVGEHRVGTIPVLPGVAYLHLAVAAAIEALGPGDTVLEDVDISAPLFVEEERLVRVVLLEASGAHVFKVLSGRPGQDERQDWTEHATGVVHRAELAPLSAEEQTRISASLPIEMSSDAHYGWFQTTGIEYGNSFRGIRTLRRGRYASTAKIRLDDSILQNRGLFTLDCCLQTAPMSFLDEPTKAHLFYLPTAFKRLEIAYALPNEHSELTCATAAEPAYSDTYVTRSVLVTPSGKVMARVEGLRTRGVPRSTFMRNAEAATPNEWLMDFTFIEQRPSEAAPSIRDGCWLAFCDQSGVGDAIAQLLRQAGRTCYEVRGGAAFEQTSDVEFRLDPRDPAQYRALLQAAADRSKQPLGGVIHCWSLDGTGPASTTPATLSGDLFTACGTTLYVAQAVIEVGAEGKAELCLVTRGAQPVDAKPTAQPLSQLGVFGMARVIATEQVAAVCRRVDIDPAYDAKRAAELVLDEISRGEEANQEVALRGGKRFSPRLARRSPEAITPREQPSLRGDATYLITGGLGGIGLTTARWLVSRGARHLVLVGRRAPSEAARQVIGELERAGARVEVRACNVSVFEEAARLLEDIRAHMPPLRGILHGAGILDDAVIASNDWARFERVFAPKVHGAWNLHVLTQGIELDFLLFHSSSSGIAGAAGQSNYAAANAFLDGLAHLRRLRGEAALSIAWGPWREVGMAARLHDSIQAQREQVGIHYMPPAQAIEAMGLAMQIPQALVPIMWLDRSIELDRKRDPAAAPPPASASAPALAAQGNSQILTELAGADSAGRSRLLEDRLREIIATQITTPASEIDVTKSLESYGVDSVRMLGLRRTLRNALSVEIDLKELATAKDLRTLAAKVLAALEPKLPAAQKVTPAAPEGDAMLALGILRKLDREAIAASLDQFSEAEIDLLSSVFAEQSEDQET